MYTCNYITCRGFENGDARCGFCGGGDVCLRGLSDDASRSNAASRHRRHCAESRGEAAPGCPNTAEHAGGGRLAGRDRRSAASIPVFPARSLCPTTRSFRSRSPRRKSLKRRAALPSPTRCSQSPASADRPSPRAPIGPSSAASIISACASRRTASAAHDVRRCRKITRSPSIRFRRIASKSCAARRPCVTAARPSAASLRSRTSASQRPFPRAVFPAKCGAACNRSMMGGTARSRSRLALAGFVMHADGFKDKPTTTRSRAARRPIRSSTARASPSEHPTSGTAVSPALPSVALPVSTAFPARRRWKHARAST